MVKCKALCCLLMLQIFVSFHESLVLLLLSFLYKARGETQRNSPIEKCLNTSRKEKMDDEVTENLNSDPKFQRSVKMPILFYLKQFTDYC